MNKYRWLVTSLSLAACVGGVFSYKDVLNQANASNNMGEPAATIKTLTVSAKNYQKTTVVNGISKAIQTMGVRNQLPGMITQLNFTSGQIVNKGQVLLEIDHAEESAQLIAATANMALHQKMLTRLQTLKLNNEVSDEKVDKATTNLRLSQSRVAVLTAQIEKKIIRAPFTAKTGIHNLQVGQFLTAKQRDHQPCWP